MDKLNILITGSSGFIGKNLKEFLEKKSYNVFAPTHKELDLIDEDAVKEYLIKNKIKIVIHSANTNKFTHRETTSYDELNENLRMYFNLANCNQYFEKMIYFGSGAEYNSEAYIPYMKESYRGNSIPRDDYGFAKYIMSETVSNYDNIYELCLFGVFGKYEERKRRFVSNVIYQAFRNGKIEINQHCYFDYLWIEDLCMILIWFIHNNPRYHSYNVCTGQHIDLYDLAVLINKNLVKKGYLEEECPIIIKEKGWKKEYSGSNERLTQEMGEIQFTGLENSLCYMIDYLGKEFSY